MQAGAGPRLRQLDEVLVLSQGAGRVFLDLALPLARVDVAEREHYCGRGGLARLRGKFDLLVLEARAVSGRELSLRVARRLQVVVCSYFVRAEEKKMILAGHNQQMSKSLQEEFHDMAHR